MCVIFLSLLDKPPNAVVTSEHLQTTRCADVPTPPSVEDLADLTVGSNKGTGIYRKTTRL